MRKTFFTTLIHPRRSTGLRQRLIRRLARGGRLLTGVAVLAGGMAFVGPTDQAGAVDLVVNGGFEQNNGFNGENNGFGWYNDSDEVFVFDVYDHATQSYNVGADPANSGQWYFHTVGISDDTGVYQDMDLTGAASAATIDAGTVTFDIQAFLSGFGGQSDHARIEVTFSDSNGAQIGGVASILDGGIEIDGENLVHDSPETFVGFIDPSVDPFNDNDRYLGWKEYRDLQGVPVGARTARITIFEDAHGSNGNDDYVENLSFDVVDTGVEQFLKIEVNKATGAITMLNTSPAERDINFYELSSPSGSLSNSWNSFSDQDLDSVDGPDAGTTAGDSGGETWDEGVSGSESLTEAFLIGSTNFATGGDSESLAGAYTGGLEGTEDVEFFYGETNGRLSRGIVVYTDDPGPGLFGDFEPDGDVDIIDFGIFADAFGSTGGDGNYNPAADSEPDSDVDIIDFGKFADNFGIGTLQSASVPEPTSMVLVGMGMVGLLITGRKRRLG